MRIKTNLTHLVDEATAEVGQGDALNEPGVQAEEVVDGVGVVPEAVLLGEDGEGGLQEGLEHVEEAGDAGAADEAELVDEDGAEVEEAGVGVARAVDAHHLRHEGTEDGLGLREQGGFDYKLDHYRAHRII